MILVSYLQENKVKLGNHHPWIQDPEMQKEIWINQDHKADDD